MIVKEKGCQWQPFYKVSKSFFDYRPVVQLLAQVGLATPAPAPVAVADLEVTTPATSAVVPSVFLPLVSAGTSEAKSTLLPLSLDGTAAIVSSFSTSKPTFQLATTMLSKLP